MSLMVAALRDGTLDVCLHTGRPINRKGQTYKTRVDHKGYTTFVLSRSVQRGGTVFRRRNGTTQRRKLLTVFVHRLVMVKKIAVEKHGDQWREHVRDLPKALDVEHYNRKRYDNRASNLLLETDSANRERRPMTAAETAEVERLLAESYALENIF